MSSAIDFLNQRATAAPAATALRLAPYQPAWPARYRVEAEVLRAALVTLSPLIEHVGSTSVPGLVAVPVIDVLIGVADPAAVDALSDRLLNFGYQFHMQRSVSATKTRRLVRTLHGNRTHEALVVHVFGEYWHRCLQFRDTLRADAQLAEAYSALRVQLAAANPPDLEAYARGKSNFIASVTGSSVH